MKMITLILMASVVLEALVEYAKSIMYMVEDGEYKTAITQGITMILGVCLAFIFGLQLFNGAMAEVYEGLHINPTIDTILTGILFSRGSNYISDLIGRLTEYKLSTKEDNAFWSMFDFEKDEENEPVTKENEN